MMGTGEAEGERRATEAAEAAISNPLLDEVSMKGARGVLINITGGLDMTLFEVDEAANRIREEVEADAHIIFGSTFDEGMAGTMRVSVVATGIGALVAQPRPDEHRAEIGKVAALDPAGAGAGAAELPGAVAAVAAGRMAGGAAPAMRPVAALKHTEQTVPAAAQPADAGQAVARAAPALAENAPRGEAGAEAPVEAAAEMPGAVRPKVDRQPFLPPQPLVADPRPAPRKAPDPFAEAALENAGRQPAKRDGRGPSLFERMTRPGRARKSAGAAASSAEGTAANAGAAGSAPAPAGLGPRVADRPAAAKPAAAGLELPQPESEEDLLEIPAFLRRQAN